jgi:methionyl-tRNA formyltransferase
MLGTGPFAVPTFCALYDTRHAIAALVTAPLRTHRGRPVEPVSTIRDVAGQHGTEVFDPEDVNAAEAVARLASYRADLLVVCDYGQILSPATLAAARHGGINLHASLLPKYRGAAPINWAIFHGETETGVTVIHMTPQLDAGPSIAQARTAIDPNETAAELEPRLAEIGAGLVCDAIELIDADRATPLQQDPLLATRAPRLKKTDGQIDWTRSARAIKDHIRALEPWPKTYTHWLRPDGAPMHLILGPTEVEDAGPASGGPKGTVPFSPARKLGQSPPGTVVEASGGRLVVVAGEGLVVLQSVQPAGKRMMSIDEFLRGHRVKVGERFGEEEGLGIGD